MVSIRLATLDDTADIMRFMHEVWRENHILSKRKDLLLFDFQHDDGLNMVIARDKNNALVGLFGYIFYNQNALPDIAGSLWKVVESPEWPFLGFQLREYFLQHIPHRFFAAPGAGLQTKPIYHVLKMHWHTLQQFYCVNEQLAEHHLIKVPPATLATQPPKLPHADLSGHRVLDAQALAAFPFAQYTHIVPFKDYAYLCKRFLAHPIYDYEVYLFSLAGQPHNIVVCRIVEHEGHQACRIVDYYGETTLLADILLLLKQMMFTRNYEYIDFVCHGFPATAFAEAGFQSLDFTQDEIIVPNYYEPFVLKNVPVYCVSNPTAAEWQFRQCKADGDQDRPNLVTA